MSCRCCKETAPYRQYKKTDSQVYQDGIESARSWRAHWNHRPGGPFVSRPRRDDSCPDWLEYCETTARHNILYRQGLEDEMQKLNPAFLATLGGHRVWDRADAA